MRGVFLSLMLVTPALLPAQLVRGRVLEGGNTPIPRALIELRRPDGQVANRTVSSPSGSFALNAPSPGEYSIRAAAIGFSPRASSLFDVPATGVVIGDLRLERIAVTLAELEVLETSRCGAGHGGSAVLSRLLDGARTSLDVMGGTIGAGGSAFRMQMVQRVALATRRDSVITADTTMATLRWPIESIDPDSIRRHGFMVHDPGREADAPTWFGPDVRVLFADWFLEAHCFRVEPRTIDTTSITVVFEPVIRGDRVDIAGTLVLDVTTLALRRLSFAHRNLPRPLRPGMAGGALEFVELPSGLWLPRSWPIFAPVLSERNGAPIGSEERSGRLLQR